MAAIRQRNKSFYVIYTYEDEDGNPKQKWESFKTMAEVKVRKKEIEYKESVGTFVVPKCKTLNDLLDEYIALYGKTKWALSTYIFSFNMKSRPIRLTVIPICDIIV